MPPKREETTPPAPQPIPADARPVELLEQELVPQVQELYGELALVWLFRAARHKHGWAQGEPLTKEQFLAGLKATAEHTPEQR